MKRLKYHIEIIIAITIIWITLNEKLSLLHISTGFLVAVISVYFTNSFLLLGDYKSSYFISPVMITKYTIHLILQIYKSGFTAIRRMLKGDTNVGVIEFDTTLENNLKICMLANAITLTPGTITLDKQGQRLRVLCLSCAEDDSSSKELVISKFEEILNGR